MIKSKKSLFLVVILPVLLLISIIFIKNFRYTNHEALYLKGFDYNKNKDLDSIVFIKNNKDIKIKFPPHLAKKIYDISKIGNLTDVVYEKKLFSYELRLISISGINNQYFSIEKDHIHNHHRNEITINIDPKFMSFIKDRQSYKGILYNKYFFEIKSHIISDLYNLLKNSKNIKITGITREDGFINKNGYIFINTTIIDIDNKQYLIY